ncbi:glycosyltransferase [Patescibacteria group bacterium]|nr:glycosyltransferase [Patescibacteria group bacterium]MBU1499991.1 glycosyltransferase [Patescibacteria group bacterium]
MKLSFILPTFNEAGNIGKLINAINNQEELSRHKKEFIVIDDDSPDGTSREVKKLITKRYPVSLIVRKKTHGLAGAILAGIRKATGDVVVLMDTDFNHRPEDIARLLEPINKKQADLIIGSRYIPGGGMHLTEASRWQYWLSKWGNYFVNRWWLNLPVHESLSGFVAVKRDALDCLDLAKIFYGYGEYCIRLLSYCHRFGFMIKEVPVMYGLRQYGVSKSSLKRMVYYYLKTALELKFA